MFGNQQNRHDNIADAVAAGESFTSNAEKRELLVKRYNAVLHPGEYCMRSISNSFTYVGTLATSGLGGLKAALVEDDKSSPVQKSPSNTMYEHEAYSPYDKNYE